MGFALSKLWVEVGGKTNGFDAAMAGVKGKLTSTSVAMSTFAGNVASQLAMLGARFGGDAFKGTIGAASDLNETLSKVDVVFGESSEKVKTQSESLAKSFGLPKQAILDAASGIGLIGKASGQSQDQSAGMSNSLAKLAADASSFYNVPLEESLQKIKSALVGESEPIRSFGVLLSEAAVQNEALALGLTKTGKDLDEQTKVKARASLITKGLKDAEGDLERTQSSTSNQFRKFTGTIQNLGTSIGAYFLPPITKAVQTLNGWVDVISNMGSTVAPVFDMIGSTISSVFEDMNAAGSGFFSLLGRFPEAWTGAFGPGPVNLLSTIGGAIYSFVGDSLNAVGVVMRNLPDFWDIAVLRITGGIMNIGEYLQAFVANVMQMGNYIANNWSALVMDGVNLVSHAFENLGKNLYMLGQAIVSFLSDPTSGFELNWTPILDGFKATADKLPEMIKPALTSMQDQINEKIGKIGEREAARTIERNKKAVEAATAPAKAETKAAPGVKKEKEFKSESFSAGEFARKLQASITDDKDKTSEKQLMSLEAIEKYTCATAKAATSPKVATLG